MKSILLGGLLGWSAIVWFSIAVSTPRPALATATTPMTAIGLSDNTPVAVKAAITQLYPTAKNVKFEKENGDYEAGFTYNGKSMSVVLDAKGTVKETETGIAISALPPSVRDYVAKHYAGKKIMEAAEIVDAQGKKTYEAEVGGKDLMFNAKGAHIN